MKLFRFSGVTDKKIAANHCRYQTKNSLLLLFRGELL